MLDQAFHQEGLPALSRFCLAWFSCAVLWTRTAQDATRPLPRRRGTQLDTLTAGIDTAAHIDRCRTMRSWRERGRQGASRPPDKTQWLEHRGRILRQTTFGESRRRSFAPWTRHSQNRQKPSAKTSAPNERTSQATFSLAPL